MYKNASDISCILAQRQYIPGYGVLTVSFWLKPFKKSIYMCKNASEISCILAQRLYIPVQLLVGAIQATCYSATLKGFPSSDSEEATEFVQVGCVPSAGYVLPCIRRIKSSY